MTQSSPKPTQQFRGKLTRTSLLLLLPLTLIPVAILGIITLTNTSNFLRDQITTQFINVGDKQSELINDIVKTRENYLQTIAKDNTFRVSLDALLESEPNSEAFRTARNGILTNYDRLNRTQSETYFSYFLVVSPEKEILVSTYPLWQGKIMDQSVYDELLFKSTSQGLYNVFPFHTEEFTDRFLVFSSQRIYDSFGNHIGTMVGITGSATFQSILELGKFSYAEARSYYITNPDIEGEFVGLSSSTGELTPFEPSADQLSILLPQTISNNQGGVLEFISYDNEDVLAVVRYLPSIEAALILEAPQSVITEPLQASAQIQIALLIVALVILSFAIWLATQRIVNPILEVSRTAQDFADGNLRARTVVNRKDEIGLLAYSFNHVADELVNLNRSLESQVEARTRQIRAVAEVTQISTSTADLEELLARIVELAVEQFGYYHSAIYLLDRGGDYAVLQQAAGKSSEEFLAERFRVVVGSHSIIGTVAATNAPWAAHDVKQDPYYEESKSLPETQSEAAVPLSISDRVMGVLDVQSDTLRTFDEEEISTLETLAKQAASAIQNLRLLEETQIDLQSTNLLYQTSHRLADVTTKIEVIETLTEILGPVPTYTWATFNFEAKELQSVGKSANFGALQKKDLRIPVTRAEIKTLTTLSREIIQTDSAPADLLDALLELARQANCQAFTLMPLMAGNHFSGLILLGSDDLGTMTPTNLEPYYSIAEMAATALEKIAAIETITESYAELQSLNSISQAISTETDLNNLFEILHRQIIQAMGEINFLVALYNSTTEYIEIPYMTDGDRTVSIPSFPLGQGLTSIVIRSQQPLMIIEDTVNRAASLGAIITSDKPAQSWLGVPMIVGGEVVGTIVVQDTENEFRFDEDDLRLLTTLSGQVAPIIRNARLLGDAQEAAERDRQLYEITDKIRRATSIEAILETTTKELSQILDLKQAKIEITVDPATITDQDNGAQEISE
ncbi:MAG TPA: hypothetical protein DEH25_05285 [Chloroflexi bacterium]|nr:hypothetical protein [Chloroflexota bacterium]